ncbi:MAG: hypothetical protein J7M38_15290 [Armatimonadetes bacterium]|nr:hypothetical protein [Armatimonadota bacterium]
MGTPRDNDVRARIVLPLTRPIMAYMALLSFMAAFVLASIPTLLVFMFCQNIILRGIIIPQMK